MNKLLLIGELKARAKGPRKFLNLVSEMPFPDFGEELVDIVKCHFLHDFGEELVVITVDIRLFFILALYIAF